MGGVEADSALGGRVAGRTQVQMVPSWQQHFFLSPRPVRGREEIVKPSSSQLGCPRPSVSVSFTIAQSSAAGIRVQPSRAAVAGGASGKVRLGRA